MYIWNQKQNRIRSRETEQKHDRTPRTEYGEAGVDACSLYNSCKYIE